MAKIAILGTGNVARALTGKLLVAGHDLSLGSRTPQGGTRQAWLGAYGERVEVTDHAAAAAEADIVINALPGDASLAVLQGLREVLSGKVLVDLANALALGSDGFPTGLLYPESSLAEALQRALPGTKVIKTLSTIHDSAMANPTAAQGPLSVFVSGDDGEAKESVKTLLADLGWPREWILDLGDIASARDPEAIVLWMAHSIMPALGAIPLGITFVRGAVL